MPRDELHTCHIKKKKKKKLLRAVSAAVVMSPPAKATSVDSGTPDCRDVGASAIAAKSETDLPALEDYFNNYDENNRLQRAKERCIRIYIAGDWNII